jgi:hypothetical protein
LLDPELHSRLAAAGIALVAETDSHSLFTRDNFIGLVPRVGDGFGNAGSTGTLTEDGLAYLVWRDGRAFLKSKTAEVEAEESQVEAIRQFSRDLEAALQPR